MSRKRKNILALMVLTVTLVSTQIIKNPISAHDDFDVINKTELGERINEVVPKNISEAQSNGLKNIAHKFAGMIDAKEVEDPTEVEEDFLAIVEVDGLKMNLNHNLLYYNDNFYMSASSIASIVNQYFTEASNAKSLLAPKYIFNVAKYASDEIPGIYFNNRIYLPFEEIAEDLGLKLGYSGTRIGIFTDNYQNVLDQKQLESID